MTHPIRFWLPSLLSLLLCCPTLNAEDVRLREQAVQLMERANAASLLKGFRDYEQVVSFTFHDLLNGQIKNGTFSRTSAGSDGHRDELTYGTYHAMSVFAGDRTSTTRMANEAPEIFELLEQLPIYLGRFDDKDVIRSIEDSNVLGRAARCINFDTHLGAGIEANQVCVDAERGTLLRWHVGDELIENSDFFQFATLWEPGHIRHFVGGALRLEIEQRINHTSTPVDVKAFSPPSGAWQKWRSCQDRRRPVGISMPMPPPGTQGTSIADVVVRGFITDKGGVQPTVVVSSLRPDLNEEAMKLVATWKFTPLMCNDQVAATVADFVVHFQDR
jgi:hypothetical protein